MSTNTNNNLNKVELNINKKPLSKNLLSITSLKSLRTKTTMPSFTNNKIYSGLTSSTPKTLKFNTTEFRTLNKKNVNTNFKNINNNLSLKKSQITNIQLFDFRKNNYKRDYHITYKNPYFTKGYTKNYVISPELESIKLKTFKHNKSHDRIFPSSDNSFTSYNSKLCQKLKLDYKKPSTLLQKYNNKKIYLHSIDPFNKFSKKFDKSYYGKGLSRTIIGTNNLLMNTNSVYIKPKEKPEHIKILSIFKNDDFLKKKLKKAKSDSSSNNNKSFKTLNKSNNKNLINIKDSSFTGKYKNIFKENNQMKDIFIDSGVLGYNQNSIATKVNNIPFLSVKITRFKNI